MHVWANPPYSNFREFLKALEEARSMDSRTRAIAIIPRSRDMDDFYKENNWRRMQYWHKGARRLFYAPAKDSFFGFKRRAMQ